MKGFHDCYCKSLLGKPVGTLRPLVCQVASTEPVGTIRPKVWQVASTKPVSVFRPTTKRSKLTHAIYSYKAYEFHVLHVNFTCQYDESYDLPCCACCCFPHLGR